MESSEYATVAQAAFLAEEIATRAGAADKAGQLPQEDVTLLGENQYFALSVPREFGGHGLSLGECVAVLTALAQGSASTAMVVAMPTQVIGHQNEIGNWPRDRFAYLCREAAAGGLLNNIASEPALGSPSRGGLPTTTAVLGDDGTVWTVNGRKTWSTGGEYLTHMLVRVAVGDESGLVLVPGDAPGICWEHTWRDALSLRASDSHDVLFHNVVVPHNNLIEIGDDHMRPNVWFPLTMSAVYLGAAIAARNTVIQFSLERVPTALGKPIATLPKIQRQIGEIDIALQAATSLLREVAAEWRGRDEEREAYLPRIAAAKTLVTETATAVTDKALRIAGGTSITRALPLERYFRDVRAGAMQPPAGDTALEMVGRAAIATRRAQ